MTLEFLCWFLGGVFIGGGLAVVIMSMLKNGSRFDRDHESDDRDGE